MLLVVKNGLQHGWRAALVSILGNLGCQAILIGLVAMGWAPAANPASLFVAPSWRGGYLCIWAAALRAANTGAQGLSLHRSGTHQNHPSLLREAFLVSASNPKTIVFLCALLPQFLDHQSPLTLQFITMYLTICAIVSLVHLCYVALARRAGRYFKPGRGERPRWPHHRRTLHHLGGAILLSGRP